MYQPTVKLLSFLFLLDIKGDIESGYPVDCVGADTDRQTDFTLIATQK